MHTLLVVTALFEGVTGLAHVALPSRLVTLLVAAMALYHTGVAIVLAYASLGLALSGLGLWPTALFHAAMTVWCLKISR